MGSISVTMVAVINTLEAVGVNEEADQITVSPILQDLKKDRSDVIILKRMTRILYSRKVIGLLGDIVLNDNLTRLVAVRHTVNLTRHRIGITISNEYRIDNLYLGLGLETIDNFRSSHNTRIERRGSQIITSQSTISIRHNEQMVHCVIQFLNFHSG